MFDVNPIFTYDNIPKWYKDIRNVCKDIPFVMKEIRLMLLIGKLRKTQKFLFLKSHNP